MTDKYDLTESEKLAIKLIALKKKKKWLEAEIEKITLEIDEMKVDADETVEALSQEFFLEGK
jgi:hypothetical protein